MGLDVDAEHVLRRQQVLAAPGERDPLLGLGVIPPHGVGDVREVPLTGRGHDDGRTGRHVGVDACQRAGRQVEHRPEVLVHRGHAVVVEASGDRAEHRNVRPLASHLPTHVSERVRPAAAVELVDRHRVGVVEHVDLLELTGRAELRRHHVQRHVGVRHDARVTLTDSGRLDDHEVESRGLAGVDHTGEGLRHLTARRARGERPEEDVRNPDRVHADAITEQCAAAFPPRGIDGDDGDAQLVLLVATEPVQQLVRQ